MSLIGAITRPVIGRKSTPSCDVIGEWHRTWLDCELLLSIRFLCQARHFTFGTRWVNTLNAVLRACTCSWFTCVSRPPLSLTRVQYHLDKLIANSAVKLIPPLIRTTSLLFIFNFYKAWVIWYFSYSDKTVVGISVSQWASPLVNN